MSPVKEGLESVLHRLHLQENVLIATPISAYYFSIKFSTCVCLLRTFELFGVSHFTGFSLKGVP
jgi:hypothetical protein